MRNIYPSLFLLISVFFLLSCSEEEVCTVCTESTTDISSEFCDSESAVELFESELIDEGAKENQDWSCVRK